MVFTVEQKTFMIESYFRNGSRVNGAWTYSVPLCLEEFRLQFPHIALEYQQFRDSLSHAVAVFRETGSLGRKAGSGRPSKRTPQVVEEVEGIIDNDQHVSIPRISQQVGLSVGTCHKILRKDLQLYPYRVTTVQELLPADLPRRMQYCEWFQNTLTVDGEILSKTFFTDEAWFHRTGYVNSQNFRTWSTENPHVFIETPLHPEKVGVWAAISQRRIIGPIFFEGKDCNDEFRVQFTSNNFFQEMLMHGCIVKKFCSPFCNSCTTMSLGLVISNRMGQLRIVRMKPWHCFENILMIESLAVIRTFHILQDLVISPPVIFTCGHT